MIRPLGDPLNILILGAPGAGKTALLQALLIGGKSGAGLGGNFLSATVVGSSNPRYQYSPGDSSKLPVNLPITFTEVNTDLRSPVVSEADLRRADALIVVVEAIQDDARLRVAFESAVEIINRVQDRQRSQLRVGGFPVSVALTQCDLLADHAIDFTEWQSKVESRRKELQGLFDDVYKTSAHCAFGSITLDIEPTATHLPETKDKRPDRDQPFGVASLFRDLFESAYNHQVRSQASSKKLAGMMLSSAACLAMLAGGVTVLVATQKNDVQLALEAKVDGFQAREGQTASARLAGNQLNRKRSELLELKNDADFERLPPDKRTAVQKSLDEIEAYLQLRDDLNRLPQPIKVRSLEELNRLEDSLKNLAIPKSYALDWAQTEAVQSRDRYLREIPQMRSATSEARQYFSTLKNRGNALLFAGELSSDWEAELRRLQKESAALPFASGDRLKLATVDFREVEVLRTEWSRAQERLATVRDLASALGLIGNMADGKAVLLLSESDLQTPEPLRIVGDRITSLKKLFPGFENWTLAQIPEGLKPQFQARLSRAIILSTQLGQRLLQQQMLVLNPTGPERAGDWPKLAEWLLAPAQKEYRELQQIVRHIYEPAAEDSCEAFNRFVNQRSFSIAPKSLKLFIPDTLREFRLRPESNFAINYRASGAAKASAVTFKMEGEGIREKNGMNYLFVADSSASAISYAPGDALSAELMLKESEKSWQFSWIRSRTASYQFERLLREPKLHEPTKGVNSGDWADGVKLTVTEGAIPAIPDLLPNVRW